MEIHALGEMQMTVHELDEITPRSLYNKITGFERGQRQDWERARIHAFINISPYIGKEKVSIMNLWPMPWDEDLKEPAKELQKEREARARETWKRVDEGNARRAAENIKTTNQ